MAIITNILAFVLGAGLFMGAALSSNIFVNNDLDHCKSTVIKKVLCTILSVAYLGGILGLFYSYTWAAVPILPVDSFLGRVVSKAVGGLLFMTLIIVMLSIVYGIISLLKIIFTSKKDDGTPRGRLSRATAAALIITAVTCTYNYKNIQRTVFPAAYYEDKLSELLEKKLKLYFLDDVNILNDLVDEQIFALSRRSVIGGSSLTDKTFEEMTQLSLTFNKSEIKFGDKRIKENLTTLSVARKHLSDEQSQKFNSALEVVIQRSEKLRTVTIMELAAKSKEELDITKNMDRDIRFVEAKAFPLSATEKRLLFDIKREAVKQDLHFLEIKRAALTNYIKSLKDLML